MREKNSAKTQTLVEHTDGLRHSKRGLSLKET